TLMEGSRGGNQLSETSKREVATHQVSVHENDEYNATMTNFFQVPMHLYNANSETQFNFHANQSFKNSGFNDSALASYQDINAGNFNVGPFNLGPTGTYTGLMEHIISSQEDKMAEHELQYDNRTFTDLLLGKNYTPEVFSYPGQQNFGEEYALNTSNNTTEGNMHQMVDDSSIDNTAATANEALLGKPKRRGSRQDKASNREMEAQNEKQHKAK
ncbi:hypothetical protein EJB05_10001, partial [Eragrostis curvula]